MQERGEWPEQAPRGESGGASVGEGGLAEPQGIQSQEEAGESMTGEGHGRADPGRLSSRGARSLAEESEGAFSPLVNPL